MLNRVKSLFSSLFKASSPEAFETEYVVAATKDVCLENVSCSTPKNKPNGLPKIKQLRLLQTQIK